MQYVCQNGRSLQITGGTTASFCGCKQWFWANCCCMVTNSDCRQRGRQLEKRGRYLISHSCIPFVYSFIYRFVSAVQAETKIYYPSLSWWLKLCGIYGAVTPSLIFEGAQQNMCALMCDNPGSLEAVHNPLDTLCLFLHSWMPCIMEYAFKLLHASWSIFFFRRRKKMFRGHYKDVEWGIREDKRHLHSCWYAC